MEWEIPVGVNRVTVSRATGCKCGSHQLGSQGKETLNNLKLNGFFFRVHTIDFDL